MLLEDTKQQLIHRVFSAVLTPPEFSNDPAGLVYHFTDASGLIGIVENSKLWASRAACLNDVGEVKHGLRVAETILDARTKNGSAISNIALGHLSASKPEIPIDPFVVSFCGREAKSGQWLNYGQQGHGYAIGFEPQGIMHKGKGWESVRVLYDEPEQRGVLKSSIERAESEAASFISNLDQGDREEGEKVAGHSLSAALRATAPCFKHSSFSDEEEWRVFDYHIEGPRIASQRMKNPKFRASNGRIIPFIELQLPPGNESPIREIVVGYQIDEAVARESIRFLLRTAGLSLDNVLIRRSEVAVQRNG